LDKPETIPTTINISMLQAFMPRFTQGPPTLDLTSNGELDPGFLFASIFSFVSNNDGGIPTEYPQTFFQLTKE